MEIALIRNAYVILVGSLKIVLKALNNNGSKLSRNVLFFAFLFIYLAICSIKMIFFSIKE